MSVEFCLAGGSEAEALDTHQGTILLIRMGNDMYYVTGREVMKSVYRPPPHPNTRPARQYKAFAGWTRGPVLIKRNFDQDCKVLRLHWLFMTQSKECAIWARDKVIAAGRGGALHGRLLADALDPEGPARAWKYHFDQALTGM